MYTENIRDSLVPSRIRKAIINKFFQYTKRMLPFFRVIVRFCFLQVYIVCCNSDFVCCRFEFVCCSTHFVCSKSNYCAATLNLCEATLSLCVSNQFVNDTQFYVQQTDIVCAKRSKFCLSLMGHRTKLVVW